MANIYDILKKPPSECTEGELRDRINLLGRYRNKEVKPKKNKPLTVKDDDVIGRMMARIQERRNGKA